MADIFNDSPYVYPQATFYGDLDDRLTVVENKRVTDGAVPKPDASQVGGSLVALPDGTYKWIGGSSDKVNLIAICGQSNAQGARNGGPNPANPMVKVWDAVAGAWGSSDYTKAPWTYANPNGNGGNNNTGLSFAHRLAQETGKPTYLVYYYVGGTSIDHWVFDGNTGGNGDFYTGFKSRMDAALATPELATVGKTQLDAIIWAQGEEDFTRDFKTYFDKFTLLDKQFRAEAWFSQDAPIYVCGMSTLHDRYAPEKALRYYCSYVNARCRFINSKGLKTQYDIDGTGDFTHWLGPYLWEFGFERIWRAHSAREVNAKFDTPLFWGRGTGAATMADGQVISSFHSLTSWESRNLTSAAVNSLVAATGSISWGYQCAADGNYSYCFGYQTETSKLCNYTLLAGYSVTATDKASWSAGFGHLNTLDAKYTGVFGRGHTVADEGGFAVGVFSKYKTPQTDPVVFQIGNGTSTSICSNVVTAWKSGVFKPGGTFTMATLPNAANVEPGSTIFVSDAREGTGAWCMARGNLWVPLSENGCTRKSAGGYHDLIPIKSNSNISFEGVGGAVGVTVTLKSTNVYPGCEWTIRGPDTISGTFNVSADAGFTSRNFANKNWMKFVWTGTEWRIMASGTVL